MMPPSAFEYVVHSVSYRMVAVWLSSNTFVLINDVTLC